MVNLQMLGKFPQLTTIIMLYLMGVKAGSGDRISNYYNSPAPLFIPIISHSKGADSTIIIL